MTLAGLVLQGHRGKRYRVLLHNPTPGSVTVNLFLHVQNLPEKEHFITELSSPRLFQRTSREQQFLEYQQVEGGALLTACSSCYRANLVHRETRDPWAQG